MKAAVVLVAWTFLIWTTRIGNVVSGDESAWQLVLPLTFTAFAAVTALAVWRGNRRIVQAFAGWTVVVWWVRSIQLRGGDHSRAFVAVHAVLALVSIALAVLAAREAGAPRLRVSAGLRPAPIAAERAGARFRRR